MQLNQLLSWYESTPAWAKLSPGSQAVYRTLITQGVQLLGPHSAINTITARQADSLYATLEAKQGTHKAASVCRVLRRVWNVALRYQETTNNPFSKMGIPNSKVRTVLWTEEQINLFISASVEYGLPSLGLLLVLCYTFGQRPGDMRNLKWENYDGEYIYFTQEKTGKDIILAVPESLQEDLQLVERESEYIIVREDTGLPYNKHDYRYHYMNILEKAGLPSKLQMRDARKTAVTELGELGATDSDLQNLGGHDVRTTLNTYQLVTKKAAKRVMQMRFGS